MKIKNRGCIDEIIVPPHRDNIFKRVYDNFKEINFSKFVGYCLGISIFFIYIIGRFLNVEFTADDVMSFIVLIFISNILMNENK
jgi:hypothetical protein